MNEENNLPALGPLQEAAIRFVVTNLDNHSIENYNLIYCAMLEASVIILKEQLQEGRRTPLGFKWS